MDPDGEPAGDDSHEYRTQREQYHKRQRSEDAVNHAVPCRGSNVKSRSTPKAPLSSERAALPIRTGAERRAGAAVTITTTKTAESWVSAVLCFCECGLTKDYWIWLTSV